MQTTITVKSVFDNKDILRTWTLIAGKSEKTDVTALILKLDILLLRMNNIDFALLKEPSIDVGPTQSCSLLITAKTLTTA